MVRQCRYPREHITEFVFNFGWCAFPYGLGELSEFFTEPGNGWGNPSFSIAVAIGGVDDILKFAEVHTMTVVRTVIPIIADEKRDLFRNLRPCRISTMR